MLHQVQGKIPLLHRRYGVRNKQSIHSKDHPHTPKHNAAISVSIKGHDIKTPTVCFIGSQYTDTEVKLIDRVHDISRNVTLQVLVINNSNQHVNFPKGMKIGHLEPPIDDYTNQQCSAC